MQERKRVCAGTEDFGAFIESGGCYVDKTRFLRPLLTRTGVVALFTRPRRFGKTLTMTMLRDFLKVDRENPGSTELQERLFKGLDVMEDRELCARFMGQHPVIFITLKDVDGRSFAEAVDSLAFSVSKIANGFSFLNDSSRLSDEDRRTLSILKSKSALLSESTLGSLKHSLSSFSSMLYKHYGRQVVVLIDEYDVPLAKAQQNGYHKDMVNFYNGFMSLLKLQNWEQDNPIFKIVMTGCLRVAKNQIFTGANNFTPYTVLSQGTIFSTLFGFTPKETEDYLSAFGLSEYGKEVKAQYDGYLFDGDEIYNPWDVSKFVEQSSKAVEQGRRDDVSAENFWVGSESSGTLAIKSYLGTLADEETQKLQDVCDGKEVETDINDSMSYDCLSQHNAADMWSLLLHTGYLTATRVISQKKCVVRIPNEEIMECFHDSIMAGNIEAMERDMTNTRLAAALLSGDSEAAARLCQDYLRNYVCPRIFAVKAPPEIFYETMLSTLLSTCNGAEINNLKVEKEAGNGYSDLAFTDYDGRIGVVVELKAARTGDELAGAVASALRQIEDRRYADDFMRSSRVRKVVAVGLAFCKRICDGGARILKDSAGN